MENKIGRTLRVLRRAKGLSSAKLAFDAKMSASHLCMCEKGTRSPSVANLIAIANALEIPHDVLFAVCDDCNITVSGDESTALLNAIKHMHDAEKMLREALDC